MAYALVNPVGHNVRLQRRLRSASDALDPMRGIILWTVISALVFWLPLGFALTR